MGALAAVVSALAILVSAAAPHERATVGSAFSPIDLAAWRTTPALASPLSGAAGRGDANLRGREPWAKAAAGPNVFGSVAIEMANVAGSARWRALLAEDAPSAFADCRAALPAEVCDGPEWPRWRAIHARAERLPARERLAYVNRAVNGLVAYRTDARLFGRRDHWASFRETVALGAGDCEDIALAKAWVLAATGVPMSSMQITVLRDTRRGVDHAVLAAHTDEGAVVLDNLRDGLAGEGELAHYAPLYSLTETGGLVHGRPAPVRQAGVSGATRLR